MKRILVIDDAIFARRILKDILTHHGHQVVGEGVNGAEALSLYKEHHPDIVFMDVTMPDVDGIAGLRMIKEYDQEAKVVMVTALGKNSVLDELYFLGAQDVIVKPISIQTVRNILN